MTNEADFPLVSPGALVVIQLKSGRYYTVDKDGNRTSEDHFLPTPPVEMIVHYPEECFYDDWADDYETLEDATHVQTICTDCISSWAMDYYIELADSQPPTAGY